MRSLILYGKSIFNDSSAMVISLVLNYCETFLLLNKFCFLLQFAIESKLDGRIPGLIIRKEMVFNLNRLMLIS